MKIKKGKNKHGGVWCQAKIKGTKYVFVPVAKAPGLGWKWAFINHNMGGYESYVYGRTPEEAAGMIYKEVKWRKAA